MRIVFAALLLAVLYGCGASAYRWPEWVSGEHEVEGMLCAVGRGGPTYYLRDARQFAAEEARKELARTVMTEIQGIMVDVVSKGPGRVPKETVLRASESITEAVVEGSEVIDYWSDSEGVLPPGKDVTYALCCTPKRIDRAALAGRLGGADPGGIFVSGRALDVIIDKLEQGERPR